MGITIAVIGVGRWGTNYLRTFNELDCNVKWICSTKDATMKEALLKAGIKGRIKCTTSYKQILEDKEVDAVAIATPGSTHYRLAKEALKSGKHLLVEKPLSFSSKNAEELVRISRKKSRILMAGHLHLFNPGIQRLKSDIAKGLFGKINFMCMSHFGNGPVRTDMGAIWDFFPHSASIFLHLIGRLPIEVSANGKSYITKGMEDIATMDAAFPNNIFTSCVGSWLYPIKKMELVVVGEKLYASFDDYSQDDKLKYYRSRPGFFNGKIVVRDYGHEPVKLASARPLTGQLKHFLECIEKNKEPITGAKEALQVTRMLEAAQQSLNRNGAPFKIKES